MDGEVVGSLCVPSGDGNVDDKRDGVPSVLF